MVNAARVAAAAEGGFFADQFENPSNFQAHIRTGSEIVQQVRGRLDAFVCGSGTGGTIAGVSTVLQQHSPRTKVYLADPPGSSLLLKVRPPLPAASALQSCGPYNIAHVYRLMQFLCVVGRSWS
jgi:cysteine synthase